MSFFYHLIPGIYYWYGFCNFDLPEQKTRASSLSSCLERPLTIKAHKLATATYYFPAAA